MTEDGWLALDFLCGSSNKENPRVLKKLGDSHRQ